MYVYFQAYCFDRPILCVTSRTYERWKEIKRIEGEAGRGLEITETFRRLSEVSRETEEREDDRSDVPEASRWLVVPLHRVLFRATATQDRLRYSSLLHYFWIRITRDRFFDDLYTRCFSSFLAASTRSFPQHQFFRWYSCADAVDDCTLLVHATCRCMPRRTVERVLSREKDYDRESSLGWLSNLLGGND